MTDANDPTLNGETDRQRSIFGDRHRPTQDGSDIDGVILVSGPSKEFLNDHQLIDYREHRRHTDRNLTWYAIRHSTGTAMSQGEGLKAAQIQLRHRDPRTTMKYDNVSNGRRRDALDRMG